MPQLYKFKVLWFVSHTILSSHLTYPPPPQSARELNTSLTGCGGAEWLPIACIAATDETEAGSEPPVMGHQQYVKTVMDKLTKPWVLTGLVVVPLGSESHVRVFVFIRISCSILLTLQSWIMVIVLYGKNSDPRMVHTEARTWQYKSKPVTVYYKVHRLKQIAGKLIITLHLGTLRSHWSCTSQQREKVEIKN